MNHRSTHDDDNTRQLSDACELSKRAGESKQPAWQFYVTLFVALGALTALAVFIYGFYLVRSR